MEMWFDHTGVDERGIQRKRVENPKAKINIQAHNASTIAAVTAVADGWPEAGIYAVALSTGGTS